MLCINSLMFKYSKKTNSFHQNEKYSDERLITIGILHKK